MKNYQKYTTQHYPIANPTMAWVHKTHLEKPPVWCSVDLRDGNQSLMVPMTLAQKVEYFNLLVDTGFKEIEIGFPAASETEFAFTRKLIEENLIPDDVSIQVLTQAREHIIAKTFKALKGVKNAIVHVYNSTSKAQREQVFAKNKEEIKSIAVEGAKHVVAYAKKTPGNFRFEYSPESFTGTEPEFALDVCNAVLDVFKPTAKQKAIINLPATVEHSLPHVFANQIEWMSNHLKYRQNVLISLHNHNDRGTAVAATELGLLAGADRVEGTFFGNGERTGNVDIITLAMNMYASGVNPLLDMSNMARIIEVYERTTGLSVHARSPYAGDLVFCAFSGSHQDAIAKGLAHQAKNAPDSWCIPYLPIDPKDVGRELETCVIRINSQSGKGGVGYVLEGFGYSLPAKMREVVGYRVKNLSDKHNKELSAEEVLTAFKSDFINIENPYAFDERFEFREKGYVVDFDVIDTKVGTTTRLRGEGNGSLDAFANAITAHLGLAITDLVYAQHALGTGSTAQAISYIGICVQGKYSWGAGTDSDITSSSIRALLSAINNSL